MSSFKLTGVIALPLAVIMVTGCRGTKSDAARAAQNSHMRSFVTLFNFASTKLGHRPANEAEFKTFVTTNAGGMLESLHINTVDELLVSERDGKPFIVLYGEPTGAARDVIAYEQIGQGGKRMVGYSLGAIAEADDAEMAKIAPTASSAR